jgi:hypothetical protein
MSEEETINFELEVDLPDSTEEERSQLGYRLLEALKENSDLAPSLNEGGIAPAGTKTGGIVDYGTLAVAVLPTAVPSLIALVQAWITQGRGRTVKFKSKKYEFEGSPKEFEKFLAAIQEGKKKK